MNLFSMPRPAADDLAMLLTAERARTLLESVHGPAGFPPKISPYHHARSSQWKAAVVAGVSCLSVLGDESDAELMSDALALLRRFENDYNRLVRDARASLASYVRRMPPPSVVLRTLAEHPCAQVRAALAEGLKAHSTHPEALKALLSLARDHAATVRYAARKAAPKDALEWWVGIFSADPVDAAVTWAKERAPRSPEKAEKDVRALIEEIYAVFAKEWWETADEEKLVAKWGLLPDALIVDLVRNVAELGLAARPSPLVAAAARRQGGPELVVELTCRWAKGHEHHLAFQVAEALKPPALAAARRAVGELAVAESCAPGRSPAERNVLAELVLHVLGHDVHGLAPWLIAAEPELASYTLSQAGSAIAKAKKATPALVAWAIAQLESGAAYASRGRRLLVESVLATVPAAERRALAWRYVGVAVNAPVAALEREEANKRRDDEAEDKTDSDPRREWALGELLRGAYDPKSSGPLLPLAESLYAVEANRARLLQSAALVSLVIRPARAELRGGGLTFPEARLVATAIRSVANGPIPGSDVSLSDEDRARIVASLANESDRTDLDETERAAYLAVRRTHRFEGAGLALPDFDVVGFGSDEGSALLRALLSAAEAGERVACQRIALELYSRPTQALVDAVQAVIPDDVEEHDDESALASLAYPLDYAHAKLHGTRLGLTHRQVKLAPGHAARSDEALISVVEARSLVTRGVDGVNDRMMTTSQLAFSHQWAVLALASSASVLHGDTSNLRLLAEAADHDLLDADYRGILLGSTRDLIALSPSKDPVVRRLAKSADRGIRYAVASALRADDAGSRALLLTLVSDPNVDVRNAARSALGEGAVPWWTGIFSRDPTDALSDEDATELAPTFAAIAAALGPTPKGEYRKVTPEKEVMRLSRALPAALACDLARQQGRDGADAYRLSPWVLAAAPREGGEAVLAEILAVQARGELGSFHGVALAARKLSRAARLRFALLALQFGAYKKRVHNATLLELVVKLLRPADIDVITTELLTIFTTDEDAFERTCRSFTAYFTRRRHVPPPLLDWAFRHIESEEDDKRHCTDTFAKALLTKAPRDRARAAALRLLVSASASQKDWALRELLGRLHVPALDGPRPARIRSLYEEPSLRRVFLNDGKLLPLALAHARADLRNHRLEFPEARRVAFATRRKLQEKSSVRAADLPAAELSAYLAVRETFRFEGATWHLSDFEIIGHNTRRGQAHLAAALAAVQAGDDEAATLLGHLLLRSANEEYFETGMAMARVYAESGLPPMLRMGLEEAHERLGIPIDEPFRRRDDDDDDDV